MPYADGGHFSRPDHTLYYIDLSSLLSTETEVDVACSTSSVGPAADRPVKVFHVYTDSRNTIPNQTPHAVISRGIYDLKQRADSLPPIHDQSNVYVQAVST